MNSVSDEMYEIGKAFVRLGHQIKSGKDTGLDSETLSLLIKIAPSISNETGMGPAKWSEEKDPIGALILEWIRTDQPVPTGAINADIRNALTRLRRNGLIVNAGTRKDPKWRIASNEETHAIRLELKTKRRPMKKAS